MNAFTQSCDPSPDMVEVWKRSLIRVTDEFTLPPVLLRVDDEKGEGAIALTQTNSTKSFDWSVGRRLYIPDHQTNHKYRMVERKGCL